jgi:dTDP-4-dehydrorhamnose 3,5-epimerase
MQESYITKTDIEGVLIIERPSFADERGFFRETFRKSHIEQETSLNFEFAQGNHSRSSKHTLRGIHIAPWHKLVTVTNGLVQQVVVDTRPGSNTFGKYFTINLGEENMRSVFVPAGCGNGFLVLSDQADYTYVTTEEWQPNREQNLAWNDPDVNIVWQTESPQLSIKDQSNPTLKELFNL